VRYKKDCTLKTTYGIPIQTKDIKQDIRGKTNRGTGKS